MVDDQEISAECIGHAFENIANMMFSFVYKHVMMTSATFLH